MLDVVYTKEEAHCGVNSSALDVDGHALQLRVLRRYAVQWPEADQ